MTTKTKHFSLWTCLSTGALLAACGTAPDGAGSIHPPATEISAQGSAGAWRQVAEGTWERTTGQSRELQGQGRAAFDYLIAVEEQRLSEVLANVERYPSLRYAVDAKSQWIAKLHELRDASGEAAAATAAGATAPREVGPSDPTATAAAGISPMTASCSHQYGIGGSGNIVYAGTSISCTTAQKINSQAEACCSDYGGYPYNCGYPANNSTTGTFESAGSSCSAFGTLCGAGHMAGKGTVSDAWPGGYWWFSQNVATGC